MYSLLTILLLPSLLSIVESLPKIKENEGPDFNIPYYTTNSYFKSKIKNIFNYIFNNKEDSVHKDGYTNIHVMGKQMYYTYTHEYTKYKKPTPGPYDEVYGSNSKECIDRHEDTVEKQITKKKKKQSEEKQKTKPKKEKDDEPHTEDYSFRRQGKNSEDNKPMDEYDSDISEQTIKPEPKNKTNRNKQTPPQFNENEESRNPHHLFKKIIRNAPVIRHIYGDNSIAKKIGDGLKIVPGAILDGISNHVNAEKISHHVKNIGEKIPVIMKTVNEKIRTGTKYLVKSFHDYLFSDVQA